MDSKLKSPYSRLIHLAAALVRGEGFLSADSVEPRTSRTKLLNVVDQQREQLRTWAVETREIADLLSALDGGGENKWKEEHDG